jgi:hypothetical protein
MCDSRAQDDSNKTRKQRNTPNSGTAQSATEQCTQSDSSTSPKQDDEPNNGTARQRIDSSGTEASRQHDSTAPARQRSSWGPQQLRGGHTTGHYTLLEQLAVRRQNNRTQRRRGPVKQRPRVGIPAKQRAFGRFCWCILGLFMLFIFLFSGALLRFVSMFAVLTMSGFCSSGDMDVPEVVGMTFDSQPPACLLVCDSGSRLITATVKGARRAARRRHKRRSRLAKKAAVAEAHAFEAWHKSLVLSAVKKFRRGRWRRGRKVYRGKSKVAAAKRVPSFGLHEAASLQVTALLGVDSAAAHSLEGCPRFTAILDTGAVGGHLTGDKSLFSGWGRTVNLNVGGIGEGTTATAVGSGFLEVNGHILPFTKLYYVLCHTPSFRLESSTSMATLRNLALRLQSSYEALRCFLRRSRATVCTGCPELPVGLLVRFSKARLR